MVTVQRMDDESKAQPFITVKELAERWRCSTGHIYNTYKNIGLKPSKAKKRGLLFSLAEIIKYEEVEQRKKAEFKDLKIDLHNFAENSKVMKGVPSMSKKKLKHWNFGNGCSIYEGRTSKDKPRFKVSFYDAEGHRRQRVASGAKSLEDAFSFLQKCLQEETDKKNAGERKKENITFREFAEEFRVNYMTTERQNWKSDSYRQDIAINHFNETPLKNITAQHIRNFKQLRTDAGNSHGTVNRYLALLKRMFNVAIEEELITKNPVKPVKFKSEQNTVVERILTDEEEQRLLEECLDRLRPVVVIALYTGMRQGELMNLKWRNVDLLAETVTVENTKGGKVRVIPLNGIVKAELMGLLERRNGDDKVFPFTSIRTAWENARRRAGLDDLRFHDLRHTFATRLVQSGANIVEIQKLLGHSTLLVTQRYTHACEDRLRRAVRLLDVQPKNELACSKICSKNIEQSSENSITYLESVS